MQEAVLLDGAAATLGAVTVGALPALPGYAAVVRELWWCNVWDLLRHRVLAPDRGHANVRRFAGLRERIVAAVEVFALLRAGEALAKCFSVVKMGDGEMNGRRTTRHDAPSVCSGAGLFCSAVFRTGETAAARPETETTSCRQLFSGIESSSGECGSWLVRGLIVTYADVHFILLMRIHCGWHE